MESKPLRNAGRRRAVLLRLLFGHASTLFAIATGLVLVPVYLRYFDLATYGAWLASGNAIGILAVLDGGFSTVVAQRLGHAHGAADFGRFSASAGAAAVLLGAVAAAVGIGSFVLGPLVPSWISAPTDQVESLTLAIRLSGAGTAFAVLQNGLKAIADAWQRVVFVGLASTVSLFVAVPAIVIGLELGLGVASLGLGVLVRSVVALAGTFAYVAWQWRVQRLSIPFPRAAILRDIVTTTVPLMLGRSASVILANSESLIVSVYINPASAAVLALTGRLFSVVQMAINPLHAAVFPGLAHAAGSEPLSRQWAIVKELIGLFSAVLAVSLGCVLALNAAIVHVWVGPAAFGGSVLTAAIAASTGSLVSALFLGSTMAALGRLRAAGWISLIDATARALFLVVLVPTVGVLGLPLASLVATLLTAALWYRELRAHFGSVARASSEIVAALVSLSGAGALALLWIQLAMSAKSWPTIALHGFVFCLLASGVVLAVNGEARRVTFLQSRKLFRRSPG